MPAEAEFSRKIVLVIGGASGIGREVALLLARRGAHLVSRRLRRPGGSRCGPRRQAPSSRPEFAAHTGVDLSSAE